MSTANAFALLSTDASDSKVETVKKEAPKKVAKKPAPAPAPAPAKKEKAKAKPAEEVRGSKVPGHVVEQKRAGKPAPGTRKLAIQRSNRPPKREFDRHDGTGRAHEGPKRNGAGRGNWGKVTDQYVPEEDKEKEKEEKEEKKDDAPPPVAPRPGARKVQPPIIMPRPGGVPPGLAAKLGARRGAEPHEEEPEEEPAPAVPQRKLKAPPVKPAQTKEITYKVSKGESVLGVAAESKKTEGPALEHVTKTRAKGPAGKRPRRPPTKTHQFQATDPTAELQPALL